MVKPTCFQVFMRKFNKDSFFKPPTICLFLDDTTFMVLVYVGGW